MFKRFIPVFLCLWCLPVNAGEQAVPDKVIVAFGDSLIAGYGLGAGESFPAQLKTRLEAEGHSDVGVVNMGVSGATSANGVKRLDKVLAVKPDIVIISLGGNDALRKLSVEKLHDNMEYIVRTLTENDIEVLICGLTVPLNKDPQYASRFNFVFKDLSDVYDTEYYPNFLEGVYGNPQYTVSDRLHPNKHGISVMVDNIYPIVKEML